MMADFADFMGKWRPQVVTWNGRGFDLPVLALRALRFGLNFAGTTAARATAIASARKGTSICATCSPTTARRR